MKDIFDTHKESLGKAIHHTLLSAELLPSNALIGGKMGKALLMYNYGRYSNNELYILFADDLIDSITDAINPQIGVGFRHGLSGIAWGFLYLIENGFIAAEAHDLLADIDREIMRYDPRRYTDQSFDTGLCGVLFYINSRLAHALWVEEDFPFDVLYYQDLLVFIDGCKGDDLALIHQMELFKKLYLHRKISEVGRKDVFLTIFKPESYLMNPADWGGYTVLHL